MSTKPIKIADLRLGTPVMGIVATEIKDSQGEILDVRGADISDLQEGKGVWNSDHRNGFQDVVGRVLDAKKIFGPDDCANEKERELYDKVKSPLIIASGYLFDQDGDHRAAKAVAAILKNQARADSPLKLKASVEGGVIKRDDHDKNILKQTKVQRVALTFSPANSTTLIETPLLIKSAPQEWELDLIKSLKPVEGEVPCFTDITKAMDLAKIKEKVGKIQTLVKAMSVGFDIPGPNSVGLPALMSNNIIKYATCGECGKDQVFHKNQIKCRGCKKNFPFDQLAELSKLFR
jgi:hypothetical protein